MTESIAKTLIICVAVFMCVFTFSVCLLGCAKHLSNTTKQVNGTLNQTIEKVGK